MAVYNGAGFIDSQLRSILEQLGDGDEIVVVDDASTDHSRDLIAACGDHRIRLLVNRHNLGVMKTFERALAQARGDYIFFSDQDDLWLPGKVPRVLKEFAASGALAVVTDAVVVDQNGTPLQPSYFAWRGSAPGFVRNFYQSAFLGCCMAVRRDCLRFLLPFPPLTYMHDQWTGLACSFVGQVRFLAEPLLAYRRHGETVTRMRRSSWCWIVLHRLRLFCSLLCALPRLLKWRLRLAADR